MSPRRAFTIIELLVVVAIIGLLTAIMLPSLRSVRTQARRTVCGTNLRQIGVAMAGYLGDNDDRFPHATFMPSSIRQSPGSPGPVYITDMLNPYLKGNTEIFKCPADTPGRIDRDPPLMDRSYFETERTSYEYRMWVRQAGHRYGRLAGRTIDEIANAIERRTDEPAPVNTIWIMRDLNNFHRNSRRVSTDEEGNDSASTPGQRNYLYVDGHVTDYEKY